MHTRTRRTAVVIGASFAGLLSAAAAARAGYRVTILERDDLPTAAGPRAGVPQSEQAHVLLHRGLLAVESLLPGIGDELLAHGGAQFNTGEMFWLGEYGWMPRQPWSYEIISLSRPLLEHVVRARVLALPGVGVRTGVKVSGLRPAGNTWEVLEHETTVAAGSLVIDASGRTSRLPHWLAALGVRVPEPTVIDSHLGYATRRYRGSLPLDTGAVIAATPQHPAGALILKVENDDWLVCAGGYGEQRPDRDPAAFTDYLSRLRDPLLADLVERLEPVSEVSIHRQTANRRYVYGSLPDWPQGLLAVGDALCAFNPIYGQGITVAAMQAELLRTALTTQPTRKIQSRLAELADLPWSVATTEDLRMPTTAGEQNRGQQLIGAWMTRMLRLAAAGDEACTRAFARVYHLMGSPWLLFAPPVASALARSLVRGVAAPAARPILNADTSRS